MVIAGIVAGGVGTRMGRNIEPKQFMSLSGKPIIIHTIEKFLVCPQIDYVIVGVHADWLYLLNDLLLKYLKGTDKVKVTVGGSNRNETIINIIDKAKTLGDIDDNTILVTHDAVRPFVSLRIINENIKAALEYGVCDTAYKATDTIIQSENQVYITDIPVRNTMYQGQTPQTFKIQLFEEVYSSMSNEELQIVTDACKLFHLRGHKVYLVEGDVKNFKITYPFDLKVAHTMVGEKE